MVLPRPEPTTVFALGHSNQSFERFVEMLRAHAIERVADVRTVPRSRAIPWASREALEPALAEAGIEYAWLGRELGGLRKPRPDSRNTAWRNASFRGYADYMETPEFEHGLDALLALARGKRTAMMCAEAVPWRCHRSLIADALFARGVRVVQVLSPTKSEPHRVTPFAKVVAGRVSYPGERPLDSD